MTRISSSWPSAEPWTQPALLCPEIDAFNAKAVSLVYDAPSTGRLHVAATKACHDRFVAEGIDLSAYNTLENIEDFVDLRKVLKVPKWNIFGTSYGTYVALTLMRVHPENIVSVTIDSISPPSARAWDGRGAVPAKASTICSMRAPPSLPVPRSTATCGASSPARSSNSRQIR